MSPSKASKSNSLEKEDKISDDKIVELLSSSGGSV